MKGQNYEEDDEEEEEEEEDDEEEDEWHSLPELRDIGPVLEADEAKKPLLTGQYKDEEETQRAIMTGSSSLHNQLKNRQNRQQQQQRNGGKMESATTAVTLDLTTTETSLSIPTDLHTLNGLDQHRLGPEAYCCCGAVQLRHMATGIAIVELLIFGYQLVAAFADFQTPVAASDPTIPEHLVPSSTVPQLLSLLSILLATIAVVLLLVGVLRRSAYMLLPHLLMQFALIIATGLIAVYVVAWLLGGVNVRVNAIFFEPSSSGEQAVNRALQRPPFLEANVKVTQLELAMGAFLLLLTVGLLFQAALFYTIFRTFHYLRFLGLEKSTLLKCQTLTVRGKAKKEGTVTSSSISNGHLPVPVIEAASPTLLNTNTTSTRTTTNNSSANSSPPPPGSDSQQMDSEASNGGPSVLSVQPVVQMSSLQQHNLSNPSAYQPSSTSSCRPEVQV